MKRQNLGVAKRDCIPKTKRYKMKLEEACTKRVNGKKPNTKLDQNHHVCNLDVVIALFTCIIKLNLIEVWLERILRSFLYVSAKQTNKTTTTKQRY